MSNESTFVFPQDRPGEIISDKYERAGGMELRDYFAAQAMPGVQVQGDKLVNAVMDAAQIAYAVADAMLLVRKLPPLIVKKPDQPAILTVES